ncbi:MAG: TauD/TfdA family dioxygenase [Acidimicrobiia bacterium]|nr:TauD/TfdA family dioxygenase [Acidimicrobiia bacterium]
MFVQATTVADYQHIRVEPITGAIGAEVSGVDLRDLDEDTFAELHDAWLAHKVLFFRDQPFTQAEHVAYGRRFGELEVHPFIEAPDGFPEIVVLESTPERQVAAEIWHSDVTWRVEPSLGSILYGRDIPAYGGDTAWADMELAYELLDDATKDQIEGRTATHSFVKTFARNKSPEEIAELLEKYPEASHPVVRTHPETGRRGLYVNRNFTDRIDDMDRAESDELLRRLCQQSSIPQIQCRFRWRPGSIAQWDNRCTQHYAIPDYGGLTRLVERVTVCGDKPF